MHMHMHIIRAAPKRIDKKFQHFDVEKAYGIEKEDTPRELDVHFFVIKFYDTGIKAGWTMVGQCNGWNRRYMRDSRDFTRSDRAVSRVLMKTFRSLPVSSMANSQWQQAAGYRGPRKREILLVVHCLPRTTDNEDELQERSSRVPAPEPTDRPGARCAWPFSGLGSDDETDKSRATGASLWLQFLPSHPGPFYYRLWDLFLIRTL